MLVSIRILAKALQQLHGLLGQVSGDGNSQKNNGTIIFLTGTPPLRSSVLVHQALIDTPIGVGGE